MPLVFGDIVEFTGGRGVTLTGYFLKFVVVGDFVKALVQVDGSINSILIENIRVVSK